MQKQKARIVVLACNGVGTPRLLLNSLSGLFPDGLANNGGQVGRNLMFHPYAMASGVFQEPLESYKGPLACMIMSAEFYETDPSRDFIRGYSFHVVRSSGPAITAQGSAMRSPLPWGDGHHEAFAERFGNTITIAVVGEDLPEPHNRVTLNPALTDSDGIPAPKIDYAMSGNSLKMMEHGAARATEALEAAGARQVMVNPLLRPAGWHLMGTARMGAGPSNSVVDGHGRSHDVKNLFIIDGSVFVTAGAVNPTSTIQAIALCIADYFKQNSRHLLD